jgi:hypothetical protein
MERIIKKSIKNTLEQIKGKEPEIVYNTFYGEDNKEPYYLAVWYFFKTNEDWNNARKNGFTEEITKLTKANMIKNGYPASAFEINIVPYYENQQYINKSNMSEEEFKKTIEKIKYSENHRQVQICFASEQDVKEKANGNYYYYFK